MNRDIRIKTLCHPEQAESIAQGIENGLVDRGFVLKHKDIWYQSKSCVAIDQYFSQLDP